MDPRFKKINRLLIDYSKGNFNSSIRISSKMDEIDAFISNINMLGEELKDTTIQKNYFYSIFDSVSDMIFILDAKGVILNANKAAADTLQYKPQHVQNKNIRKFLQLEKEKLPYYLRQKAGENTNTELWLVRRNKALLPVLCTFDYLKTESKRNVQYILAARDVSQQKNAEIQVLRRIVEMQELERTRLSKDIHDSIGQQLSAVKFYLSSAIALVENEKTKEMLLRSNNTLVNILAEMREICFNLMPQTLEEFGLLKSLKDLCNQLEFSNHLNFELKSKGELPFLVKSKEIAIFRVVQEFIGNAIKHGAATKISILITPLPNKICFHLKDNGCGFDINKEAQAKSMGLKNVAARIKSYNGSLEIGSQPGKGTFFKITIPTYDNNQEC